MPWELQKPDSIVLAVHAAFLNYDTILFFGGDEFDSQKLSHGYFEATCFFESSGAVSRVHSPTKLGSTDLFDVFCSGHALTVDGTLLVAGGTERYPEPPGATDLHHDHFPGIRDTAICRYDESGFAWRATAELNHGAPAGPDSRDTGGRWYPTLVTLGNGDVIALSGHPGNGDREHTNYIPEVFTPTPAPQGLWHQLGSYEDPAQDQLFKRHQTAYYPRAHLLPTGDVLLVSPTLGAPPMTVALRVMRNPWSASFIPVCEFKPQPSAPALPWALGTSVLLPFMHERDYAASVLYAGDKQPWILNLKDWGQPGVTPEWRHTTPRQLAGSRRRVNGNAVILPTGEILFVGGVDGQINAKGEFEVPDSTAVNEPEIYDGFTNTWSALTAPSERATVARNYHSVALLLRDGRVWTAGSNFNGLSIDMPPGKPELRIEIFEPWYYRRKGRPEIFAAPDRWLTGEKFVVRTTQATDIKRVTLTRCGSCTHAFNSDQRLLSLEFTHTGGDALEVTAPPDGNVSPPGMYFLHTINHNNLPSDGITLYMSTDPETQAERDWDALYHPS